MLKFKKIWPAVFWGIILGLVIFKVPPPATFTIAYFPQLLLFFAPLFLFFVFSINLIFTSLLWSIVISLGLIAIFILQALGFLNPITLTLTLVTILFSLSNSNRGKRRSQLLGVRKSHPSMGGEASLLLKLSKKYKKPKKNFSDQTKIPSLFKLDRQK